jgi:RimJ/RimL family protein N-acetyltransferase
MLIDNAITGVHCTLRNIEVRDVEFVIALRHDSSRNQYLNSIHADVLVQSEYIKNQRESPSSVYLVIEDLFYNCVGTLKITDLDTTRPSWGSWAIVAGTNPRIAPESAKLTYKIITQLSSAEEVVFSVSIGNDSVRRFHERCGAKVIDVTDVEYKMSITREAILSLL